MKEPLFVRVGTAMLAMSPAGWAPGGPDEAFDGLNVVAFRVAWRVASAH